jgi:hypothetical protein
MNMDYSLSEALKGLMGILVVIVFYDIMCQYGKKLKRRMQDGPYIGLPTGLTIKKGIGLFHVHGHQDSCFPRYAPNFIKGAGQIAGEIMESLWAPLNQISPSTRSMSAAARRELIDAHMNDSNWKKLTRIGMCFDALCGYITEIYIQYPLFAPNWPKVKLVRGRASQRWMI